MAKTRINPRRRPATMADVEKAKKDAQTQGLDLAICIILSALLDKGFLQPEQIRSAWDAINDKSDSIVKGYCSVSDLRRVLADEYGIFV
jgi:hypothetical protein